jgi:hypothetical protein
MSEYHGYGTLNDYVHTPPFGPAAVEGGDWHNVYRSDLNLFLDINLSTEEPNYILCPLRPLSVLGATMSVENQLIVFDFDWCFNVHNHAVL